jgi:CRISPR-associated endonuclease/helicase Cas3
VTSATPELPNKPKFAAHTPSQSSGKWHELKHHLHKVAIRAKELAEKFGAGELGYYSGLWHDLGKYNPEFQAYLEDCHRLKQEGSQRKTRGPAHAIYGAILAEELKLSPLSFLIAGHHAGLPNQVDLTGKLKKWKDPSQRSHYAEVMQRTLLEIPDLKSTNTQALRTYFQPFGKDKIAADLYLRMIFSCLIDADRLDTERFANLEEYQRRQDRANTVSIAQLWHVFEQKQQAFAQTKQRQASVSVVNQVRAEVYQKCWEAAEWEPGVFRLCVPTGGGKTRSGLAFALRHAFLKGKDRVIFAVPYTSIIEQTVRVYREEIFQDLGEVAVLEHHSAVDVEPTPKSQNEEEQLESDENTETAKSQAKLATQNWDARLIVTTTVQLFDSLFSHKPKQCRKLHNIANSVIVLDEVQTLPIGLLSPIMSVLKELIDRYHVTVVLCTATQPALSGNTPYFRETFQPEHVRQIIPDELANDHFSTLRRVTYSIPKVGETWTWEQLTQDLRSHPSSLVVLNTRRDALAVLNALGVTPDSSTGLPNEKVDRLLTSAPVLHLSTLLCGAHRRVILTEVRRRLTQSEDCTLVSTQVVEAGVDLDFPVVYRAIGPLDRIVQAAGRCNREGKLNALGRVILFEPAEGSQPPTGEYSKAMKKARDILHAAEFDESQLHEPGIFEQYFLYLYQICETDQEIYKPNPNDKGTTTQALRQTWSFRTLGENFRLIKDNTVPVIVQYDQTVEALLNKIRYQKGIWSSDRPRLQPYIVNLPQRVFNQAETRQEVVAGSNLWLWTGNYDPIYGIPLDVSQQDVVYDPTFLML